MVEQHSIESILHVADCGYVLIDGNRLIIRWNKWMERKSGLVNEQVLGKNLGAVFPRRVSGRLKNAIEAALERGIASVISYKLNRNPLPLTTSAPSQGVESTMAQKTVITPVELEGGFHCLVQIFDVTESAQREGLLRDLKRKAEVDDNIKSQFLSYVSHEFKTPLGAIVGFSDIMLMGRHGKIENEAHEKYVNHINVAGKHLHSLVDDVLNYSAVTNGSAVLDDKLHAASGLIEDVMAILSERANEKSITIGHDTAGTDLTLLVDDRRLRQVLINIVNNAIKYCPDGSDIRISAEPKHFGAEIRVRDNGPGMNLRQKEIAMQPFGRLVDRETSNVEGAGMGLPLSQGLMKLHDIKSGA